MAIGGIDRVFVEAKARVALRRLLKPFNSLSRFDVSINEVVHSGGGVGIWKNMLGRRQKHDG